ncbi:hypothetical protein BJ878DRAFT_489381 [Calycina marina]|uniref:Cnl2/NKP2 family protein n=1 Tax=Calycina marina TaxID=1763456 RepID=A0A9P7Z9Z4_9HELO|nr:hypothetical protein BJ878DRAFT_489381 [Calycina marina]
MAPPTEATILANFLLPPVPLPTILTLKAFTALFTRKQQAQSPDQIRALYRDLQASRVRLTDAVAGSIEREVKKGFAQRRVVVQSRRRDGREEVDDEVEVEKSLFGATSNLPAASKPHSLNSILPEMESAVEDVEDEIRRTEEETEILLEEMRSTVGSLSDLRYGKFANGQLREQVLDGLQRLETACENK